MNELMISLFEGWQREVQVNLTVNWLLLALNFSKPPFAWQQYQCRGSFFSMQTRPLPLSAVFLSSICIPLSPFFMRALYVTENKTHLVPVCPSRAAFIIPVSTCRYESVTLRKVEDVSLRNTVTLYKALNYKVSTYHHVCSLLLNKYVFMQMSEKCGEFISRLFQPLCELRRTSLQTLLQKRHRSVPSCFNF